jgi:hypothetical protein
MVLDPLTAIIDPHLSPLAAICLPSPIIGSLDIAFGEIGDEPASYHGRADTFSEPNQSKAKGSCHPPLFATTGHLVQFQTARIIIIASQQDRANARPMTGSGKQSILRTVSKLDCFASLAMT